VFTFGGVYSDMDTLLLKGFDQWVPKEFSGVALMAGVFNSIVNIIRSNLILLVERIGKNGLLERYNFVNGHLQQLEDRKS
jgi:mannosyltransferase OCH1-like enzyme